MMPQGSDNFPVTGPRWPAITLVRVLLSDRDIRAEIAGGRLGLEPFQENLIQPSSIDVRLDGMFRVFNNTRYTHIDPAQRQDELTSLVEPAPGEPFVLHPGEFVLGSTLEVCTLPDDLAGRLEGKSSLGGSACSPIPPRGSSIPGSAATSRWSCRMWRTCRSRCGRA